MEKTKPKHKTSGKRNKNVGHSFERDMVQRMKETGFPNVITTRAGSRNRDAQGVDLMNDEEGVHGRLPYNIQCKATSDRIKYDQVLARMPVSTSEINVILHRYATRSAADKRSTGQHFVVQGTYAILDMDNFFKLISVLKKLQSEDNNAIP